MKLPSLNGLRFVSIVLVLLGHLSIHYGILTETSVPAIAVPFVRLFTDAQLGVTIFFVISGFLINTLLLKEESLHGRISWKHFFIRRSLRIFPAYVTLLLVYFILTCFHHIYISPESWLTSLTYTKYLNWDADWYTAHFWSLSIEEQFYLLWPLIFLAGNKTRKRITFLLFLIVPIFRVIAFYGHYSWMDDFSIFQRIDAIAIGCLIAFYYEALIKVLQHHWRWLWWTAFLTLILLHYLADAVNAVHLWWLIVPTGTSHGTIANLAIGILLLYSLQPRKTLWFAFLNHAWINRIGIYSYGIYLWQQLFLYHSNHWYNKLPYNLLLLASCVLVSYHLIERPFMRLKSRYQHTSL